MQACVKSQVTEWVMNVVGVILAISLLGSFFFVVDWWRKSSKWFKIAGGLAATLNSVLLADWILPIFMFLIALVYLLRTRYRAKKAEQRFYTVSMGVVKLCEVILTIYILSQSMNGGCTEIWADFDRVKDENEEWKQYQESLFTDSTPAEQASQIYETWKVARCSTPAKILAGLFGIQCITGIVMVVYFYLSSRHAYRPLKTETTETSGYQMELLSQ